MGVNSKRRNIAYGLGNPLQSLAPEQIVSNRNPTARDIAPLGQIWVNRPNQSFFILTDVSAGVATWASQTSGGSGTFGSVDITGTSGTVLEVASGGDTVLGGDLSVAGPATFAGNLTVGGDFVANGDFDITSADAISISSTSDTAPALSLLTNGGTSETMVIEVLQGDTSGSLLLSSRNGGVLMRAGNSTQNDAININAESGGYELEAVLTSSINVSGASEDLQLNATGGSIIATATESVAGAITLDASGVAGTVSITGAGGVSIAGTNNAVAVSSGTGAMNISTDASATTVSVGTGAAVKTVVLGSSNTTSTTTVQSGSGALNVTATGGALSIASGVGAMNISADAADTSVNLATGAAVKTLVMGSTNSTSSTALRSGSGALALSSSNGVITVASGTGAISVSADATATAVNVATGAGAKTLIAGSVTAGSSVTLRSPALSGVIISNGTQAPGIFVGTGDPNTVVTAPQGSLYLNVAGSSSSTRLFVNSDGATAWVAITTAS